MSTRETIPSTSLVFVFTGDTRDVEWNTQRTFDDLQSNITSRLNVSSLYILRPDGTIVNRYSDMNSLPEKLYVFHRPTPQEIDEWTKKFDNIIDAQLADLDVASIREINDFKKILRTIEEISKKVTPSRVQYAHSIVNRQIVQSEAVAVLSKHLAKKK
jgi:hypothetical protein